MQYLAAEGLEESLHDEDDLKLRGLRTLQLEAWSRRFAVFTEECKAYRSALDATEAALDADSARQDGLIETGMDHLMSLIAAKKASLLEEHKAAVARKRAEITAQREATAPELKELQKLSINIERCFSATSERVNIMVSSYLLDEVRAAVEKRPTERPTVDVSFRPFSGKSVERLLDAFPFAEASFRTEAEMLSVARMLATELTDGMRDDSSNHVDSSLRLAAAPTAMPALKLQSNSQRKDASQYVLSPGRVQQESGTDDDDDDDEMDDAEFERRTIEHQSRKSVRQAISAEKVEKDPDWKAPVYKKTPEQESRLRDALSKCFMFAALPDDEFGAVIAAFQETPAAAGTTVIEEGAEVGSEAPALYVIESGQLEVLKKGTEKAVFTYTKPGQYFGDLALLYNAPRAATVIAKQDSQLWSIDRNTFNFLVKDAARQAQQRRTAFLADVPLLKDLTSDEYASLCEALRVRSVEPGTFIVKEGEEGSEFYIVEDGKCEARKQGQGVVKVYEAKSYFGELALLNQGIRKADVVAMEQTKLLVLDAGSFRRLLGPLDELMRERAKDYETVPSHAPVAAAGAKAAPAKQTDELDGAKVSAGDFN